jgi:hypothetical protein
LILKSGCSGLRETQGTNRARSTDISIGIQPHQGKYKKNVTDDRQKGSSAPRASTLGEVEAQTIVHVPDDSLAIAGLVLETLSRYTAYDEMRNVYMYEWTSQLWAVFWKRFCFLIFCGRSLERYAFIPIYRFLVRCHHASSNFEER